MVKNLSASAGDIRDTSSIPGSRDPLEEGMATHSSTVAWRIPRTEDIGSPQPGGSQTDTTEATEYARFHLFGCSRSELWHSGSSISIAACGI